jgi:hypothetical protein
MRPQRARRRVTIVVLVSFMASVGLLVVAPVLAAGPSRAKLCKRFRCRTLAADVSVQVFQTAARHAEETFRQTTYAQWLPTGRVTALGDYAGTPEGTTLVGEVALTGRFAAYALALSAERYQGSGFTEAVGRLNAQTGKRERIPANGAQGGGLGEKSPGVTDVAVTPKGSVAWILDGSFQNPIGPPLPGNESVLPLGSKALLEAPLEAKTPTVLAVSATIDPKSLAAIPGHLYWLEGGTPRTAAIQ